MSWFSGVKQAKDMASESVATPTANLEEYLNGLDPTIWNPPLSDYTQMSIAGTMNTWNPAADFMSLVHHHQWESVLALTTNGNPYNFKFTADGDTADLRCRSSEFKSTQRRIAARKKIVVDRRLRT